MRKGKPLKGRKRRKAASLFRGCLGTHDLAHFTLGVD
jgi:hypothetical protein